MNTTSSGIDWVTFTEKETDQEIPETLRAFMSVSVEPQKWHAQGYSGKQCRDTGVRWGKRKNKEKRFEYILVASGYNGGMLVDELNTKFLRCTRIDLQTTTRLKNPDPDLASRIHNQTERAFDSGSLPGKRRKCTLVLSNTGQSLYVGSRKSRGVMLVLYDKSSWYGLEKGSLWRQEARFGREVAQSGLAPVIDYDSRTENSNDMTVQQFNGIIGWSLANKSSDTEWDLEREAVVNSAEQKLAWIRKCVKPCVLYLLSLGYEEALLEALGLELLFKKTSEPQT